MTDRANNELDILARPGANDQVIYKKVLLAVLACADSERLNIVPDEALVAQIQGHFLADLDLPDEPALAGFLAGAGLSGEDFQRVMQDFAAVVAVESHYANELAARVELHRRLVAARMNRLQSLAP